MHRHTIRVALLALVALGGCRKGGYDYSPASVGYGGEGMAYEDRKSVV